jgi:hypothetical protein
VTASEAPDQDAIVISRADFDAIFGYFVASFTVGGYDTNEQLDLEEEAWRVVQRIAYGLGYERPDPRYTAGLLDPAP